MHNNAMRWLGQISGPARGAQSLITHDRSHVLRKRPCVKRIPSTSRRGLNSSPKLRGPQTEVATTSPSSPALGPDSAQDRTRPLKRPRPPWVPLLLIFAASAGAAYMYRRQSTPLDDDVINTSKFTAFTITGREQVSPTAFIITLRPSTWVDPKGDDGFAGFLSTRIGEAWRHGLWSVEIKQPQLQIARHYTPLPPLLPPSRTLLAREKSNTESEDVWWEHEEPDWQPDLRILIRKVDGGEMSNYLWRQRVGDTIWLRGPHLGFDVLRRLGDDGDHAADMKSSNAAHKRNVVFLAGGTGIAPALQTAHKILENNGSSNHKEKKTQVSILWANRWGIDALGRDEVAALQPKTDTWFGWLGWGGKDSGLDLTEKWKRPSGEPVSSLALQIQYMAQRYPSQFKIVYFVDREGSFINTHDIESALAISSTSSHGSGRSPSFPGVDENCTWHSAKAVELLPDDNDASRSSSSDPACACTCAPVACAENLDAYPGVDLICVSGPDGFIEAYAGGKRWHDGHEMQGATRGLLGRMKNDKGNQPSEWLVLKL